MQEQLRKETVHQALEDTFNGYNRKIVSIGKTIKVTVLNDNFFNFSSLLLPHHIISLL